MAATEPREPRARAWAAAVDAARRRAGVILPDDVARVLERFRRALAQWIAAELAPGRLLPWFAVAYGGGIVLYFAAEREPAWWAAVPAAIVAVAVALLARERPIAFPAALAFAAVAGGFATATLQTARIAHPVLRYPVGSARIAGFVETREERERSDRIVVRLTSFEARRVGEIPARVRVAVRRGTAPDVGSFVALKAHLSPPLAPLRPGGYDFARDMYFQGLGASGYALGRIETKPPPVAPSFGLRFAGAIDAMRESINRRIQAILPGDRGSIASALITGKRGALSAPVSDAFYVSSLAHVLAISGYHMAVVAGIAFFFVRGGLALFPGLAVRRPIKKWAAAAAFAVGAFYLVLSGASVSTQRAFIMIAIVLAGILVDRPTLTFRTITIAALVVLAVAPQAILHPSFEMSFAAALALIAAYQFGLPFHAAADTSRSARLALWGVREVAALILASTVAGLATTPYAAFHFHRLAPYGVLANLLAMPVVSALVMPMGILAVLTMPFGLDGLFWRLMGEGIDWMIAVVLWVAHLPGAVGRMHAFGPGPLLLGTGGLLLICLLRTPLRLSGAALFVAACVWAALTPQPDMIVSADGQTVAVRGADGRFALLHSGRDRFALKEWLAADADGRTEKDASLRERVACDPVGCTTRLPDGRIVAVSMSAEAFAEDCARAAVVVTPRSAPPGCAALAVDRDVLRARGAVALRKLGDGFERAEVQPAGYDRPWARATEQRDSAVSAVPQDATPRRQDLEADD
jgi:competence protein ComEC